jgi:hypothetical protein
MFRDVAIFASGKEGQRSARDETWLRKLSDARATGWPMLRRMSAFTTSTQVFLRFVRGENDDDADKHAESVGEAV